MAPRRVARVALITSHLHRTQYHLLPLARHKGGNPQWIVSCVVRQLAAMEGRWYRWTGPVGAAAAMMTDDTARLRLLYELGCAFAARMQLDALSALVVQKCREVLDAE